MNARLPHFIQPRNVAISLALARALTLSSPILAQETVVPTPAQKPFSPQTPANSAPAATSSTPTSAAGVGTTSGIDPTTGVAQPAAKPGAEAATEAPAPDTLAVGLELYSGVSNLQGQRRFSDGFWASGAGLAYPSSIYLRLQKQSGLAAKVALGTGDLYRGSSRLVKQPVELWVQKPVGKLTLTGGKFYVPFALQEWEFETKYGVQLQRALGASDFAASLNYDRFKRRLNLYFRAGHNFNEKANVGVSLGAGEGLSYGSVHNKAVALDASVQLRDFKLFTEALTMQKRSSDRFNFFYSKLVYDKYERVKPFVSYYKWNDKSGAFSDFRSVAYGATVALKPEVLLEGGGAATANKNIYWLQLHLLLEKPLLQRQNALAPRAVAMLPGMMRPNLSSQ